MLAPGTGSTGRALGHSDGSNGERSSSWQPAGAESWSSELAEHCWLLFKRDKRSGPAELEKEELKSETEIGSALRTGKSALLVCLVVGRRSLWLLYVLLSCWPKKGLASSHVKSGDLVLLSGLGVLFVRRLTDKIT